MALGLHNDRSSGQLYLHCNNLLRHCSSLSTGKVALLQLHYQLHYTPGLPSLQGNRGHYPAGPLRPIPQHPPRLGTKRSAAAQVLFLAAKTTSYQSHMGRDRDPVP